MGQSSFVSIVGHLDTIPMCSLQQNERDQDCREPTLKDTPKNEKQIYVCLELITREILRVRYKFNLDQNFAAFCARNGPRISHQ
jgi:hypothetical protein